MRLFGDHPVVASRPPTSSRRAGLGGSAARVRVAEQPAVVDLAHKGSLPPARREQLLTRHGSPPVLGAGDTAGPQESAGSPVANPTVPRHPCRARVIEKTRCWLTREPDPGDRRLLAPCPVLGVCVPLAFPTPRGCSKDKVLRW